MSEFTLHVDKNKTSQFFVRQINGQECVSIVFGEKLHSDYVSHDERITMFMSLNQLLELYSQISVELDKFGVHS